jgi:hypothetical protein
MQLVRVRLVWLAGEPPGLLGLRGEDVRAPIGMPLRTLSLVPACALLAGIATTMDACLASEVVDLGSNFDASPAVPDSSIVVPIEASVADSRPDDDGDDSPGEPDGLPPSGAGLCIPNSSFETGPDFDAGMPGPLLTDPPGWTLCPGSTTAPQQACVLPPSDGSSYLGLSLGFAPLLIDPASVDVVLCQALQPGVTYSISADVALDAPPPGDAGTTGETPPLDIRASNDACDPASDVLLRLSATNSCGWQHLCGTFVPQQSYTHLILVPQATASTALNFSQTNILVDNLGSGGACSSIP